MLIEPLVILLAFAAGLTCRRLGFPPLLGYLVAGFVGNAIGFGSAEAMQPIADLGIMLLLFTIGLKLNLKELAAPQVWGVASLHMLLVIPLTAIAILVTAQFLPTLQLESQQTAWLLAFALSFSSTVFAVKIFDERGEGAALHALIAIGILIIQDLIAVIYLVLVSGKPPSLWALALLLLPLARPVLLVMMRLAGHGELLVLFGICVAIGIGELFDLVHLKAGLGALIAGVLLGNTDKTTELYKSLLDFKDVFLIGFFLQIGYHGLPTWEMLLIGLALSAVAFLRPLIYFALLVLFKLRARTALLTGFSLFSYSEFGLIVAALAVSEGLLEAQWITTLAIALSLSFFVAIPLNTRAHLIYARMADWLHRFEREQRLDEETPVNVGKAAILILGMGRVGMGAWHYLQQEYPGEVLGVDDNIDKARELSDSGIDCIQGDATDNDFLSQVRLQERELILISLSNHAENRETVKLLRANGFDGDIAVVSRFPDEERELIEMGCITFNLYAEAGHGFAEHVLGNLQPAPQMPQGS